MVHASALCKPKGKELTVRTLNVDSNAIFFFLVKFFSEKESSSFLNVINESLGFRQIPFLYTLRQLHGVSLLFC